MHWLLSVPDTFSLREVVRRSGWFLYPPYHVLGSCDQLQRIETLGTDHTVGLTVYQAPAGLVLQTDPHLSGQEIEEASQKVWRLLRLEENLQAFLRMARRSPALESVSRLGARLVRGATLYEDVLTAAAIAWRVDGTLDRDRVATLVNRLGDPLPANPTLHSFPRPSHVLDNAALLDELFGAALAETFSWVARVFAEHDRHVEALVRRPISSGELEARLAHTLHLGPASMGLLMLNIGRYDYVPTDAAARYRLKQRLQIADEVSRQDVQRFFEPWQPWGGLAYWLWDWSKVPESDELRFR